MAASPITLAEAAVELDVDASTLRHQIRKGRLKAEKRGASWWITRRELERYRAEHKLKPSTDEEVAP
jgi:excisionase family DNA binding protein